MPSLVLAARAMRDFTFGPRYNIDIDVNLVWLVCAHHSRSPSQGVVVVGSLSGMGGQPTEAAYSAAKAFEQVFCEAMWSELRPDGIDVVSVPLGATRTPGLASAELGIDPEVIPPAQVVNEAIEHLGDGPVFVPVGEPPVFDKVTRLPRREAAEAMARLAARVAQQP
jgi:short-subunit dehydrogenase